MPTAQILQLKIERFRGITGLSWLPAKSTNVILGGGDAGKTTILDAIALLLAPTNNTTLSDADYARRDLTNGFRIEAIMSLPPEVVAGQTLKPAWPWEWKDNAVRAPSIGEDGPGGEAVYVLRVTGTPDLELLYEIVQPSGDTDHLPVGLRRAIGIVRLSGDDRNDRDLRLVQGSALERLLSDRALRSRLGNKLAQTEVKAELQDDAKQKLLRLDVSFKQKALPDKLNLAVTGAQGVTITALIGLTAERGGVQLPLSNWGSGTRRLAALAIAEENQSASPITLVDEVEKGLEPYRQRALVKKLQGAASQTFLTTHSTSAISAATDASLWYLDGSGRIGKLNGRNVSAHQKVDPDAFLARFSIVAEGATEVGFISALLERALPNPPVTLGVHVSDGGGHEAVLALLEGLSDGGITFAAFADNEQGKHPGRWRALGEKLGPLLFRWENGCLEENFIGALADNQIEALIEHPEDTGGRLRTLAVRLQIDDKSIAAVRLAAGGNLRNLIIEAARGSVPDGMDAERKVYKNQAQIWFKSVEGGRELATKMFAIGLWPTFKDRLLPFLNAIRGAIGLPDLQDLPL
jgi:putative ATP-dependent endonuclease of the OLD family